MSGTKSPLDEIWADAARQFQEICGESLQRGDVKSFDDVRRKIENVNKQPSDPGDDQEDKWDKAKSVGLQSLKFMKLLLGAASQAATFVSHLTPSSPGAAEEEEYRTIIDIARFLSRLPPPISQAPP